MTDNVLLLQPFCNKAKFLSGKAKVDLIEKVAGMSVVITLYTVMSSHLHSPLTVCSHFINFFFISRPCDRALPSQTPGG